jgi:pimeloyl-ACP methyl ester carboxylesterase
MPLSYQHIDQHVDTLRAMTNFLLLHGGGGPGSVAGFAQALRGAGHTVDAPVHPGFSGTPNPDGLATPGDLADHHLRTLVRDDVTVVGFSLGGWVAAEMAVRGDPRLSRLVIVDGVGFALEGHPVADVTALTPAELAVRSFHDPEAFPIAPSPEMAANVREVVRYGGDMSDPGLRARLAGISIPALVVWGESDGVADPDYGRAYAAAIPCARFELLAEAGHMPQIEQPARLAALVLAFAT